jgi:hypothetical protein
MYPLSDVRQGQIIDGTSHTFLIAECSWDFGTNGPWYLGAGAWGGQYDTPDELAYAMSRLGSGFWIYNTAQVRWGLAERSNAPNRDFTPAKACQSDVSFGSKHPSGAIFCMADGSSRFVSDSTDLRVLQLSACRQDGEPVTLE